MAYSPLQYALLALLSLIAYKALQIIYRLTLHPLARFPGPKLAAATFKYEFWFDGVKGGMYVWEIERMHREYGPIVRINPEELHCDDPAFADQVYGTSGKRRDKFAYFLNAFGPQALLSGFGTQSHDLHRMRRGAVNRYFSRASITKIEPLIRSLTGKLISKIQSRLSAGEVLDVTQAYSCFTTDVISAYCFGQANGLLDQPDFTPNLRPAILGGCASLPVVKQIPWLAVVIDALPDSVAMKMSPDLAVFLANMANITAYIERLKKAHDSGNHSDIEAPSLFRELLESDLPPEEKTVRRLGAEAAAMISAGTETTAWTLTVATYYLLTHPDEMKKLTAELKAAIPDPTSLPPWSTLEQLPYLSAVIMECLRLSYGVATRLSRLAPDETLVYEGEWTAPNGKTKKVRQEIPRNTAIGMSSVLIHHNESIFPEPLAFRPERWLAEKGLERWMMSFSRGGRQCLGMNLAYAELYICLPALVLRVLQGVELYETGEKDVKYHHDLFIAGVEGNGRGVRIREKTA